jgi:hypothetical protein
MHSKTRFWTAARSLFWAGVAAFLFGLYAIGMFHPIERWLFEFRVTMSGYDGCLCRDCKRALFGYTESRNFEFFGAALMIALICWIAAGSICIPSRLFRSANQEHRRTACGHNVRGLRAGTVCPECVITA